ncbi:hypothetical protein WN944_020218 [Citrus x changshan-huyou]|uniref:Uncharacterized protein n=1 Tax=Citrus x changshan-huyou TaxID=2935761 RepID=A0AAP0LWR7_9ROSI
MAHPCQAAQKLLSSNLCELFTQKVEVIHARDKVNNIPTVSIDKYVSIAYHFKINTQPFQEGKMDIVIQRQSK